MQISENKRIRLLSLAQESGQARCKAASSGQNTRNTIRASWQQELRCQKDAGSSCPERHSRQSQNGIPHYERIRVYIPLWLPQLHGAFATPFRCLPTDWKFYIVKGKRQTIPATGVRIKEDRIDSPLILYAVNGWRLLLNFYQYTGYLFFNFSD